MQKKEGRSRKVGDAAPAADGQTARGRVTGAPEMPGDVRKKLVWKNLAGHDRIKAMLGAAFENGSLGHAYLFCGNEGCGTFQAALELAMAALCRGREAVPCYGCASCRKIAKFAHPDLKLVFPVCLQKEHRASDNQLTDKGWEYLSKCARERIAEPYLPIDNTGIPAMPVEWIREVTHAVRRGTVSGSTTAVIMCGVDQMNKESANAMLKTLEEPPPGTLIILCTDRPHAVLPTIMSRCQIVRFGFLPPELVEQRLRERFTDPDAAGRIAMAARTAQGNLGAAIELARSADEKTAEAAGRCWSAVAANDWSLVARTVEELAGGGDFGFHEKLFALLLFSVRQSFFSARSGCEKYVRGASPLIYSGIGELDIGRMERAAACCEQAIAGLRARGNARIIYVTFFSDILELMHEQDNKAG